MDNAVSAIYRAVAVQSDESIGNSFAAWLIHGEGLTGPVDIESHAALGRANLAVIAGTYDQRLFVTTGRADGSPSFPLHGDLEEF